MKHQDPEMCTFGLGLSCEAPASPQGGGRSRRNKNQRGTRRKKEEKEEKEREEVCKKNKKDQQKRRSFKTLKHNCDQLAMTELGPAEFRPDRVRPRPS